MRHLKKLFLLFLICLWIAPFTAHAQDCPTIVQEALGTTATVCTGTPRNRVCYGNGLLEAEPHSGVSSFAFGQPGDMVDIVRVQTLRLGAMNTSIGSWGVALMSLQASLPDTLPGQNVTVVLFGEVVMNNSVRPLVAGEPAYIHTTEGDDLRVRSGPGTSYDVLGGLPDGTQVTVLEGPNSSGGYNWWRVRSGGGTTGWVVEDVDDNNERLATLVRDAGIFDGPMQAFYFQSGIGDAACAAAPDSGILVQTPEGVGELSMSTNEVDIAFGSTVYMQAKAGGDMWLSVIEGHARITTFGVTQTALAGTRVRVPIDDNLRPTQAPTAPIPYDPADLSALPLSLLPRQVSLPTGQTVTTTPEVTLGTGDVQVTLRWDNRSDLDLYVTEPNGIQIYHGNRLSDTGGQLDVDANYPCGENLNYVENIFWPTGYAPTGSYQVWVREFDRCGENVAANWSLVVLVNGRVALETSGSGNSSEFTFRHR